MGESGPPTVPRDPDLVFAPGERCGQDYVIHALVARGGMAQIYHARHEIMRRDVAIKVLAPRYVGRSDVRARMEAEARALAEIDHPNIVKIFHAGRDERVELYIVMELLDGKDLRTIMDWAGALPIVDAVAYAIEIADATAALHELGIFHRDIKPENVFVVRGRGAAGRVLKLLDLGAAKIPKYGQRTTGSFNTIGTGAYMSPEHVKGQPITAASDVYSLGLMLYEMIVGAHPFGAGNPTTPTHHDFCRWQLLAKPEPLRSLVPRVSAELDALVGQSLEKDPLRRPTSMAAFASSLRTCLREALRHATESPDESVAGRQPLSARQTADTVDGPATDRDSVPREKTTRPDRSSDLEHDTDLTPVVASGEPPSLPRNSGVVVAASPRSSSEPELPQPPAADATQETTEAPTSALAPRRTKLWTAPLVGVAAAVVLVLAVIVARQLRRPVEAPMAPPSATEVAPIPPEPRTALVPSQDPSTAPEAPSAPSASSSAPAASARPLPASSGLRPKGSAQPTAPPPASDAGPPPPFKEIF